MQKAQMALAVGILVIVVILGSLWFLGKNFHALQPLEEVTTNEITNNALPEGWGIFVVDGMTIAYPGAPWTLVPVGEDAVLSVELPGEEISKARVVLSTIATKSSFEETIVEDVTYVPSGSKPEDVNEFDLLVVGGRTWYVTQVELFEAQSVRAYYLKRSDTQVIKVTLLETGLTDWAEPAFKPGDTDAARTLEDMITFLSI